MNEELRNAVRQKAVMSEGRHRLSCAAAFAIAERFSVTRKEVGLACDELGIKIMDCQLGCF